MMPSAVDVTIEQSRRAFRDDCQADLSHDVQFIDRDEYCELILSRRRLARQSLHQAHLVILNEIDTGQQFVIESEKLG